MPYIVLIRVGVLENDMVISENNYLTFSVATLTCANGCNILTETHSFFSCPARSLAGTPE